MHDAHGPDWKSKITYTAVQPVVLDATTGRLLHTIPLPHGLWSSWQLAAAAPDNRTFVLSAVTVQPDPSPTASTTAQDRRSGSSRSTSTNRDNLATRSCCRDRPVTGSVRPKRSR
jgi:hypothetical protein